jgi:hypothetical protein
LKKKEEGGIDGGREEAAGRKREYINMNDERKLNETVVEKIKCFELEQGEREEREK